MGKGAAISLVSEFIQNNVHANNPVRTLSNFGLYFLKTPKASRKITPNRQIDTNRHVVEIHGSRGAPLNDYIPDVQKKWIFSIVLQWWQIPENKCHQSVYLDDADDFYFWTC